ncbi:MAG TPA: carbamoyl-phosphate synthase large subunit [Candidatus Dormibacteraeota bacterium]|nr:carbamoyl-phosphate synthase large subunit [Candidatus Dormibacteraeota bacterium]
MTEIVRQRRAEGVAGLLVLESGASFTGTWIGAPAAPPSPLCFGEVVFNTCMTGYQEVCTDPSYAGQLLVFTQPLIGNVGAAEADMESSRAWCRGVLVAECSPTSPHWQAQLTFGAWLEAQGVPGLERVDTRALTRHLREHGTLRGVIAPAGSNSVEELAEQARRSPSVSDQDLVAEVSCATTTRWEEPLHPALRKGAGLGPGARGSGEGLRIAVLDLGVKRNTLRSLVSRGAEVLVLPHSATLAEIDQLGPDGVVLTNGPGDPATLGPQVELTRALLEQYPVLAICLGHQLVGRAIGGSTSRLPFGHHGGNHPVWDLVTGEVFVTPQNHEFQVDAASIGEPSGWFISERNLNDDSVEGLRHRQLPVISVQYHPEGSPGPQDRQHLFDEFLGMCRTRLRTPPRSGLPPSPPARTIRRVLVLGSGPIVIGQAAEFDYAGTQACRSLREEGMEVVLVNSNPATIMTDEEVADRVYLEPLTVEVVAKVIERERPDGLLAGLGGQTALNLAVALDEAGVLERFGVQVLGTPLEAVRDAEDRERFKRRMVAIGEPVPPSRTVNTVAEASSFARELGLPLVVRPAFTLGGTGGGLVDTEEQLELVVAGGLQASPITQVLVEQALVGWRELEYEVMRDGEDTCICVCNMENLDPMGVHTGDSVVVAPSQTLTDKEHQQLRSAALRIIRALKIEGGCNVQFALAPDSFTYFVIEVNPRVSRSSALASKATGYPIARVAAKIAVGRSLREIRNQVTGRTCAAFEPSLDYCVAKSPRWPFDKFPHGDRRLGTQMKSTGEAMAIGRTFESAISKVLRSLEQVAPDPAALRRAVERLEEPTDLRLQAVLEALRQGRDPATVSRRTGYPQWFCDRLADLIDLERDLGEVGPGPIPLHRLQLAKRAGLSDRQIADLTERSPLQVEEQRRTNSVLATFKCVDTCAAEFDATTPYFYSSYEVEDEQRGGAGSAVVLGSGPIRIGQGIEFDYCSVQAAAALRQRGLEAVMINSNPETVSTDFDCSSRLYFEPMDLESVLQVCRVEQPVGVMVQFGGQTAVNLAGQLHQLKVPLLGSAAASIEMAEDRGRFEALLQLLEIARPPGAATRDPQEAERIAERVGYPVLVRPSYVLGGRAMDVVHSVEELRLYLGDALAASGEAGGEVLIDKYILGMEVEVDAICDGQEVLVPGVMEHIERAGVHSGDSMAVFPPQRLDPAVIADLVRITTQLALGTNTLGLINVQYVVHRGQVLVIEVNPRASRTVPFLSKVTGVAMVDTAVGAMLGESLRERGLGVGLLPPPPLVAVKAPVFSARKLDEVDTVLGPEMTSTGEVIGVAAELPAALEKAFWAALGSLPRRGGALVSIADQDKSEGLPIAARLAELGFSIYATPGTAAALRQAGISVVEVSKLHAGRPNVLDVTVAGQVALVINTISGTTTNELPPGSGATGGRRPVRDGYRIRQAAVQRGIPCLTSLETAAALVSALGSGEAAIVEVATIDEHRRGSRRPVAN